MKVLQIIKIIGISGLIMSTCVQCNKGTDTLVNAVINPVVGATYHVGQTREIKWRLNSNNISHVSIALSLDSGATFPITLTSSLSASATSYSWEITKAQASSKCIISVHDADNDSVLVTSGMFTVDTIPLVLLSPLGDKNYVVGDTVRIKWRIMDRDQISSVEIVYSLDGGHTYSSSNYLGTGSFSYPDTSFLWTITNTQKAKKFVLKVRDYNNHILRDSSSAFIIAQ
jgi:hypothetical protein